MYGHIILLLASLMGSIIASPIRIDNAIRNDNSIKRRYDEPSSYAHLRDFAKRASVVTSPTEDGYQAGDVEGGDDARHGKVMRVVGGGDASQDREQTRGSERSAVAGSSLEGRKAGDTSLDGYSNEENRRPAVAERALRVLKGRQNTSNGPPIGGNP